MPQNDPILVSTQNSNYCLKYDEFEIRRMHMERVGNLQDTSIYIYQQCIYVYKWFVISDILQKKSEGISLVLCSSYSNFVENRSENRTVLRTQTTIILL